MNKERRKKIKAAISLVEQARKILETVIEEEQSAFDNLPENIQYSERGEQMEEYISTLEAFIDSIDTDELVQITEG